MALLNKGTIIAINVDNLKSVLQDLRKNDSKGLSDYEKVKQLFFAEMFNLVQIIQPCKA